MFVPDRCSVTSQNLYIGQLQKFVLKNITIVSREDLTGLLDIKDTVITEASLTLQTEIAKEMGK